MRMYSVLAEFVTWLDERWYAASTIVPGDDDAPARFVTVERTGGSVADMVDHPTIAVQCWAPTDEEAEAMAVELRNSLLTELPPVGVTRITVNSGPYRFYDEYTRCPRYQLVLDVTCQLTD